MPTYTPAITVSTRVAKLVKDASERVQTDLNALDWFIEETRKLAVSIARAEYYEQKKEAGDASKESIDGEVTT